MCHLKMYCHKILGQPKVRLLSEEGRFEKKIVGGKSKESINSILCRQTLGMEMMSYYKVCIFGTPLILSECFLHIIMVD